MLYIVSYLMGLILADCASSLPLLLEGKLLAGNKSSACYSVS
jgi:hypothetical protein